MVRLDDIIELAKANSKSIDVDLIRKAYVFSAKVHRNQLRLSGEPYLVHPLDVAYILANLRGDAATIAAGLLHDTVEDTLTTLSEVETIFGEDVAHLVDGVTKLSKISFSSKQQGQLESLRKLVLAMAKDIRVVLIKLADRLHNMRTLGFLPGERQLAIAQETLDIYAPLANRLGIYWVKAELEDLALRYLDPEAYYELAMQVGKKRGEREEYIAKVCKVLKDELTKNGILCEVTGRPKHFYSIHNKMTARSVGFDQVYDAFAFRVIVPTIKDCYAAIGITHAMWKPIPGRFKDYIAFPKANGYQSLHTTVFGPEKDRIEIQVRTEQMHQVAEEGIAAHWQYKEGQHELAEEERRQFTWLRQTLENYQDLKDPADFLENLKLDLFPEEVYVFTPKGDIKELPKGACPIDFAFAVHTEVGMHCIGAKVDGRLVPLDYPLKNGDVIDIMTSRIAHPSRDWLTYVKTSKAKSKVKAFVNLQQLARQAGLGREILEKEMRKLGFVLSLLSNSDVIEQVLSSFRIRELDTLFAQIAQGNVSVRAVIEKIAEIKKLEIAPSKEEGVQGRQSPVVKPSLRQGSPVRVDGIDNVLVRFGSCCGPVVGDTIVGFVTRGRGVTIHAHDCSRIAGADPSRLIQANWSLAGPLRTSVEVRVTSKDKQGLLAEISKTISLAKVNISKAQVYTTPQKVAVQHFTLDVESLDQLNRVLEAIRQVKGVIEVERLKRGYAQALNR
ncbi:MAG: bifunctional (p)ppGpp synthetase/guanosine-3',5'-bis(diphosphate) 3'-pyrophosphohydrolase [Nitrospirota bacterium]|nr:bifunctional (p)ppGpp synthetase/guanosine-3',5'-bis(diphosphate) 3'-pyrophosphohydrolase [Nitrospirota bacterium]